MHESLEQDVTLTSFDIEISNVFERHFKDLTEESNFYHYTTLDAVISMVDKGELWLSHPAFSNDLLEINYGLNVIHKIAEDRQDTILKGFSNPKFMRRLLLTWFQPFVFCLTRHRDHMPQWQAYAGRNGCSILFDRDIRKIRTYPVSGDETESNCGDFLPVIYDTDVQAKCASELYELIRESTEDLNRSATMAELFARAAPVLIDCAVIFKHPSFRHEGERRLFHPLSPFDRKKVPAGADPMNPKVMQAALRDDVPIRYRPSERFAIPYVIGKLGDNERLPIREIMIGPSDDAERMRMSLEHLMTMKGYGDTPITMSEIPLSLS